MMTANRRQLLAGAAMAALNATLPRIANAQDDAGRTVAGGPL